LGPRKHVGIPATERRLIEHGGAFRKPGDGGASGPRSTIVLGWMSCAASSSPTTPEITPASSAGTEAVVSGARSTLPCTAYFESCTPNALLTCAASPSAEMYK
jgi:hypothetical protein